MRKRKLRNKHDGNAPNKTGSSVFLRISFSFILNLFGTKLTAFNCLLDPHTLDRLWCPSAEPLRIGNRRRLREKKSKVEWGRVITHTPTPNKVLFYTVALNFFFLSLSFFLSLKSWIQAQSKDMNKRRRKNSDTERRVGKFFMSNGR